MAQQREKQILEEGSDIPRNSHFKRRTEDRARKNESSKRLANTQNDKGSASLPKVRPAKKATSPPKSKERIGIT